MECRDIDPKGNATASSYMFTRPSLNWHQGRYELEHLNPAICFRCRAPHPVTELNRVTLTFTSSPVIHMFLSEVLKLIRKCTWNV